MPIETSPIPFGDQLLPYNPRFAPGGEDGMPMAPTMAHSMMSQGPAAVAGSAIIGADPGGLASPHHAIPALPDAGYTAPTIRAVSIAGYPPNIGPSGGGGPVAMAHSIYGGGSMYGGGAPHHVQIPEPRRGSVYSDIQGHGHGHASLPEPRRAPVPLAPSVDYQRSERHHSPRHEHHHDRDRDRERGRQRDWDDGASDASYYAMPKHRRSGSQSSGSEYSTISPSRPRGQRPRAASVHSASAYEPQLGSSASQGRSPVSPSPLARRVRAVDEHVSSPLAQAPIEYRRSSLGMEDLRIDERRPGSREGRGREREQSRGRHNHKAPSVGQSQSGRLQMVPGSVSDSEEVHSRRHRLRSRSGGRGKSKDDMYRHDGLLSPGDHHRGSSRRPERPTAARRASGRSPETLESPYHPPTIQAPSPPLDAPYLGGSVGGSRPRHLLPDDDRDYRSDGHHDHQDHHHHHTPSHGHHSPVDERAYRRSPPDDTRERRRSHANEYLYGDDKKYPQDDYRERRHSHVHQHSPEDRHYGHRRAVSEMYEPPPATGPTIYPNQSPSQIGMPTGYVPDDDGGSAVGSQMTFMDGVIDGRVSQYGLPKYAHNPKVDYRRFCVQRGKADVFLD